jgi:hypothetical protein
VLARRLVALLLGTALLTVAGCGGSGEPLAQPLPASPAPAATEVVVPSPEPSPSPSPMPLSPFEGDSAVVALRAYLAASSTAINSGNLDLPEFAALATTRRAGKHKELYTEDLGSYFPGPPPTAVTGVRVESATLRVVSICLLEQGFALDKPGGTPTAPRTVSPGLVEVVLEGEQWRVDYFLRDEKGSCDGVPLPGDPG